MILSETTGIANSPEVQAVSNSKLGIAQIVFYMAAEVKVFDNLTVGMESPGHSAELFSAKKKAPGKCNRHGIRKYIYQTFHI
jgi:hypothetical protein